MSDPKSTVKGTQEGNILSIITAPGDVGNLVSFIHVNKAENNVYEVFKFYGKDTLLVAIRDAITEHLGKE